MVNIHEFLEIHYAIQLAVTFVTIATGCWKKSYSTTIFFLSSLVLFYHINDCADNNFFYIINILSIGLLIRAMMHHEEDTIIRKGKDCA